MIHQGAVGNTGVRLTTSESFVDSRGWLTPAESGFGVSALNTVFTSKALTLRGLHYQAGADAQDKLIRVLRGAVFDVAVDLSTRAVTVVNLLMSWTQWLRVPAGHAHGYMTLRPDTIVEYVVSGAYKPESERGLRWDDPALGIEWPRKPEFFNERDASWPLLGS